MEGHWGDILESYASRLGTLRGLCGDLPMLGAHLFEGFEDWERLLVFKLAPRLSGSGTLIVAIGGGTNTGKSTIFNSLIDSNLSPVSPYGAYTRHPLVAVNPERYAQCLERGKLLPEGFIPKPWQRNESEAIADGNQEPMVVFVARESELPERLLLLDTPDIDSVVRHNWELAKSIREAGDVLIAVVTAQKYADSFVVEFFQEALRSGRHVIPLLNMADDEDLDFAVTRRQLEEFCGYLTGGLAEPVAPERPFILTRAARRLPLEGAAGAEAPVPRALDEPELTLRAHLESLDAAGLKQQIMQGSLERFCAGAGDFVERLSGVLGDMAASAGQLGALAHQAAAAYDPKPGREVVTVVYDFIQKTASAPDRMLGAVTAQAVKIPKLAVMATRTLLRRKPLTTMTEQGLSEEQRRHTAEIVSRLYEELLTRGARYLRERTPYAAEAFENALRAMDPNQVAEQVMARVFRTEDYMADYRAYAYAELEKRWQDRTFRWTVKWFYRMGLLGSWAGVLMLLWAHGWAPGLPLSEILASLGMPVLQHTATHGAIYLWGDKLAGLVRKWQSLQREALEQALLEHLVNPALGALPLLREQFAAQYDALKELNNQCRIGALKR